jgi:beta-lactamase regulating signal transducer with metallopeptidase domain
MTAELISHIWQSTLFVFVAALLTVAFRKNRANVRYWLWLSASLKFFAPFALLVSLGGHLGWTPVVQRMIGQTAVVQRMAAPHISLSAERIAEPFPEPLQFPPTVSGAFNWTPFALFVVWACGFAVIGLFRLRSWRRVSAAINMSAPSQIPAAIEIRSSPGLLEPGVAGILRPVLLLPEGITDRLTPSQLDAVLAHELCHVRRRDNLFAAIHMAVEALFWFYPLVWWIGARLVEERERACDECVLAAGSEPRIYADAILTVCKLYVESPLVCMLGVTGANLKRRIEAIMKNRTGQSLNRAKKCLLAAAGIATLACPVALGVLIGAGNAPVIYAQSPARSAPVEQPTPAASAPAPLSTAAPQRSTSSAAPVASSDHRLLVMLFDFDTMTSVAQARSRQSAAEFIRNKMAPADLVAFMSVKGSEVRVLQDFTGDRAILESTLGKIGGREGNGLAAGPGHWLSNIETTVDTLGSLPGKKALMYFADSVEPPVANDQAQLRRTIDAAIKSNVAIYTIDTQGVAPEIMSQSTPVTTQDEQNRRAVSAQGVVQASVRSNWPPPLAKYESDRAAGATIPGFPSGHFTVDVRHAGAYQTIAVPVGGYYGQVQITGQIRPLANISQSAIGFGELIQSSAGAYEASLVLEAGSYVCTVLVTEQATGQMYSETATFEVK